MSLFFVTAIILVIYSYIGYPLLLWLLVSIKKLFFKKKYNENKNNSLPEVTLVIPAYNEKEYIDEKMRNTFEIDYPSNKLNVIWITDGSDDGSDAYLYENYPKVKLLHQKERKGKAAAINRVMQYVQTEIVVFCDANTYLNKDAIRNIVKHFQNSKIGCVAGEKRVRSTNHTAGEGESIYWKYESLIKKWSSELHSCIGAVGELMAFRKALFQPIPEDTILDDFVISMQIAHKGFSIQYEAEAYAEEYPSANEKEEMKRKIRIAAGSFQCMWRYIQWLNIFKHPLLTFQYFSHKITRWILVPLLLPFIFLVNINLFFLYPSHLFYQSMLFVQLCVYIMVLVQHYAQLPSKIFRIPYYVMMMNIAMYKGFIKYITGQQSAIWEKSVRQKII